MLNFQDFIKESLSVDLGFIFEGNKKIWPVPQKDKKGNVIMGPNGKPLTKWSAITIMTGDHVEDRKSERKVEDQEIIDAVFGAKNDIKKLLQEGKLKVSHYGEKQPVTFVIMDARKNKQYPLTVVGFVSWADKKFKQFSVIVKTVGRFSNFSSIMRKDTENEQHIQLY